MIDQTVLIPAILRGKLEFGNRAQIDALQFYNVQLAKQEEHTKLALEGKLRYFQVNIKYDGWGYVNVWAKDEENACDLANYMGDPFDIDWEIDEMDAEETKPPAP